MRFGLKSAVVGIAAVAVLMASGGTASAKLTDLAIGTDAAKVAGKCVAAIQKNVAKYAAAYMKLIIKCKAGVIKGKGGSLGACGGPLPADLQAKDDGNYGKLESGIAGKCCGKDKECGVGSPLADIPLADINWDIGTCRDFEGAGGGAAIADAGDIAPCLRDQIRDASHQIANEFGADQFIAAHFGAGADPGKTQNKCQSAAFKSFTKFYLAKSKIIGKCWASKVKRKGDDFDDAIQCPDTDVIKGKTKISIEKTEKKLAAALCKKCGGVGGKTGICEDKLLTPTGGNPIVGEFITAAFACPAVTVPPSNVDHFYDDDALLTNGVDCSKMGDAYGAPGLVDTIGDYVNCMTCVSEYKADCLVAKANGENAAHGMVYPTECLGVIPPDPCGNGVIDGGEACDPNAPSPQCPGAGNGYEDCNATCECECPNTVTFEADPNDPGSSLSTGFSGFAHNAKVIGLSTVTVALSGGSSGADGIRDPDCGVRDISGPLQNPAADAGQTNVRRCSVDYSITCGADSDCPAVETCITYFGSRLPLSAGGVSACVTNRFTAPIVGTANIETGSSANSVSISSEVVTGPAVDKPCDNCLADLVANDGSADGTCDTGSRAGLACDVNGTSPVPAFNGGVAAPGTINGTSLDCPNSPLGSNVGILPINLSNSTGTETLTVDATGPGCTAAGFGGSTCMCDTCDTLAGEPCNKDADCLPFGGSICGGLRCLGGGAAGTPCTTPGIGDPACAGAPCGGIGEPTKPNTCTSTVCAAGACGAGPFNGFCGPVETFRGCLLPSDCPFPGDSCGFIAQPCFDDNGVVGGTISATGSASVPINDVSSPNLASVFCVQPTGASAINAATGLPGAGAVSLAGTANGVKLTCGNGVIDPGEDCDPAAAGPQCPGAGNGNENCNVNSCTCSCPSTVTFEADPNDPGSILDTGFTGFAHNSKVIGLGVVTVGLSGGSSGVDGRRDPDCGVMDITGPLQNPAAGAGQMDVSRCSVDYSITCGADSDCPAVETCITYFGSRLPLSAGGVSACVTNRFTAPIVGTANIETGSSANTVSISSEVVVGPAVDKPCDNCIADLVANDGSADGTCDTGDRAGLACDVMGVSPVPAFNGGLPAPGTINGTSLDCANSPLGSNVGILPINLSNSTGLEALTVDATGPTCTAAGFGGSTCMCDTCDTLAGEPCNKDADCLPFGGSICGGLRCLGGGAAGAACTTPGIGDPVCLGAPCGNIGEPTKPNTCTSTVCAGGVCGTGPFNGFCGPVETFRGCLLPSDCPFPGDSCGFLPQPCFDDNGVVGGTISAAGSASVPVNDVSTPTLASTFCVQPTGAAAINAASGFPGAGRVSLSGTALGLP